MNLAYWGPMLRTSIPFLPTPPPIAIDWDGASNVESLQFSFDGFAKTQWVVWILADGVIVPIPVPDTNPISPPLGQKEPLPLQIKGMSGLAKYTPVQAAGLALARAAADANVISGSGSLDVMRYGAILPARTLVEVRGAGVTYDGQYFVESTSHTIMRGSYKQDFTLSRNRLIASGTSPLSTVVQQLGGFAAAATAAPQGLPGGAGVTVSPPGPSLAAPVLPAAGNTGRIAALPASP